MKKEDEEPWPPFSSEAGMPSVDDEQLLPIEAPFDAASVLPSVPGVDDEQLSWHSLKFFESLEHPFSDPSFDAASVLPSVPGVDDEQLSWHSLEFFKSLEHPFSDPSFDAASVGASMPGMDDRFTRDEVFDIVKQGRKFREICPDLDFDVFLRQDGNMKELRPNYEASVSQEYYAPSKPEPASTHYTGREPTGIGPSTSTRPFGGDHLQSPMVSSMEGGSSSRVSEFCNLIVSNSWLPIPKLPSIWCKLYPILHDVSLPLRDISLASTDIDSSKREGLNIDPSYTIDASLLSKVDLVGMKILSSFFNAFSITSDTISKDNLYSIGAVSQRLAQVRPITDFDDGIILTLAKKLVNMTLSDQWLWKHIQTNDFDGTWVAIICGFYQRLYLYHTQIVEQHCLTQGNKSLLQKGKIMVLLLRLQHLQKFQYIVSQNILQECTYLNFERRINVIEMLESKAFLISSLLESLRQTMDDVQRWAKQQVKLGSTLIDKEYSIKHEDHNIQLLKMFLASILPNMLDYGEGLQNDKWLWKHFHNLDGTSNDVLNHDNWTPIIGGLYQGLYLYHLNSGMNTYLPFNINHTILVQGKLTVLLYRSQHLQVFEHILRKNLFTFHETFRACSNLEVVLLTNLLESLIKTINTKRLQARRFNSILRCPKSSEVLINETSLNDEKITLSKSESIIFDKDGDSNEDLQQNKVVDKETINWKNKISLQSMVKELNLHITIDDEDLQNEDLQNEDLHNVFLGSGCLPNDLKVEDLIDINFVNALGGLICTMKGDPINIQDIKCTSWCIIRHDITGLLFCVDLKDDEYRNKHHILDGTSIVDYQGILEVATMDGKTTVKSLQNDGSCFSGDFEDFADRRVKITHESCAAKALHILPQSDFLKDFNLKCSALHLLALAFSVRNEEYLTFNWKSNAGHIEYHVPKMESSNQSQQTINSTLQKCNVLYTREGMLIGEDVSWKGDCWQRSGYKNPRDERSQRSSYRLEAGENMKKKIVIEDKEKISEDKEKISIILEHCELWISHQCVAQDVQIDEDQIQASMTKARKKREEDNTPVEVALVLAQFKKNTGAGVGAVGFKFEGHHEYRPEKAEIGIEKFLYEFDAKKYHKTTVVVHPDLLHDSFKTLQVQLKNGTIAEHLQEFFVVKTNDNCSMQVYLYIYEKFIWLTDVVVADTRTAKRIFEKNLKGKLLTITRSNSLMKMNPNVQLESFSLLRLLPQIQQKFLKPQKIVTEETMIHKSKLQNFPSNEDQWNLIIGQQKEYNKKNYYLKATEMQAIVCSATHYTTGGALLRTKKQIHNTNQPSTSSEPSSSSNPSTNFNSIALQHGSCVKVCNQDYHIEDYNVEATGKFSTFKGIGNSLDVYWG